MTWQPLTPEQYRQAAAESRAKQGLPPTVEDPAVLARVAELMLADRPAFDRAVAAVRDRQVAS